MSKIDRTRKRIRQRGEAPEGMGLADVPRRKARGDRKVPLVEGARDAQKVALSARCRAVGIDPNRDNRRDCSGPMDGEDIGRALRDQIDRTDAQLRYWRTWCGYTAACRAFSRVIGAPGVQCSGMPVAPSREATADMPAPSVVETEEEHYRRTVAAYMAWKGYLARITSREAALLIAAQRETGRPLWADGRITGTGRDAVAALVRLTEALEA